MPRDFSTEVRDFILRLLVKNPRKRLGASGASEVKKHKFFKVQFNVLFLSQHWSCLVNTITYRDINFCGYLYFHGYQYLWIEVQLHIHGFQNSWPWYFLHNCYFVGTENHQNLYPMKIKPCTVICWGDLNCLMSQLTKCDDACMYRYSKDSFTPML